MTPEQEAKVIKAVYSAAQSTGGGPWIVDVDNESMEPRRVRHESNPIQGIAAFMGTAVISSGKLAARASAALRAAHKAWKDINR